MSEINKVRVKGVLYDLGGSGGGTTGGVSGAWLAPGELIESGYIDEGLGWSYMTIDPEALVDQLEKAGIDVEESPFMDNNENDIVINIGRYYQSNYNNTNIITVYVHSNSMSVSILGNNGSEVNASPKLYSLRQLIYRYFSDVTNLHCSVPSSGNFSTLANYIEIHYNNANTTLRYYIPDMSEFCDEMFIEYTPSSE